MRHMKYSFFFKCFVSICVLNIINLKIHYNVATGLGSIKHTFTLTVLL